MPPVSRKRIFVGLVVFTAASMAWGVSNGQVWPAWQDDTVWRESLTSSALEALRSAFSVSS
ncbi:MAG: hypothetical protein ACRD07_09625 [Acidimicrobiales bacterium]